MSRDKSVQSCCDGNSTQTFVWIDNTRRNCQWPVNPRRPLAWGVEVLHQISWIHLIWHQRVHVSERGREIAPSDKLSWIMSLPRVGTSHYLSCSSTWTSYGLQTNISFKICVHWIKTGMEWIKMIIPFYYASYGMRRGDYNTVAMHMPDSSSLLRHGFDE